MDETTPLSGGRRMLAGRYELRGLVGQGGMADVELAQDTQLDRQVAVKILHSRYAQDPAFVSRFRREAQASASLNHPNVVAVYDTGEADGRPFIVMEYVSGRSLKEVMQRETLLPERAAEIAGDAALALYYANQRGLVHRDIKPGNIMISDEGTVKVTDFGIARAVNAETVTQTAAVFGTAAYVAPEQAQGEPVDGRTDIYALGCVLYEMLTGQAPFAADSPVALAYKHVSTNPTPPSELNPEVSQELEAVVLRAMAKDPEQRYETGRDFNADLQRAAAGMPVAAPPVYAYEQTQAIERTLVDTPQRSVEREEYYEDDYDDYHERPRRRRGLSPLWILLFLLILAVFAVGGLLATEVLAPPEEPTQIAVPDVVGMAVEDAQAQLIRDGLRSVLGESVEPSEQFPTGTVASVDPPARSLVAPDSEVTLIPAGEIPVAVVPDVAGFSEEEAQALLRDAGFGIGPRGEEPSTEFEAGVVIRAEPESGEDAPQGSEVVLVVSTGPADVAVPNVTNFSEGDAIQTLRDACEQPLPCLPANVSREFNDDVDEGVVIRQDPAPDTPVAPGSAVAIVVSRGPEEEPTEPEPTEPEPTEPEPTEPEPTEPEPTEPEPTPTEPEPTEPEPTPTESP